MGKRDRRKDRMRVESERHPQATAFVPVQIDGGFYQGHSQGGGEACREAALIAAPQYLTAQMMPSS